MSLNPLSSAVPGAIAAMLRSAPLSPGKVTFAWHAAVGPALQRATTVRLEQRVLIVEVADARWAREVSRSSRMVIGRMQALLGEEAVSRLEIRSRC